MWTYSQLTGYVKNSAGMLLTTGYSGANEGKNNPDMQDIRDVGPIPRGMYTIDGPIDTAAHGPYALPLIPDPENDMNGRAGFLIHGDSKENPGQASEGCVIVNRLAREMIWGSNDNRLQVI